MKTKSENRISEIQNTAKFPPRGKRFSSFPPLRGLRGFSLLEVMVAMGILCIGTFAILALISSSLANARRLQRPLVDASALVAQLSLTNQLVEGTYSGNLSDVLGKAYNEYKWTGDVTEVGTNRLFQADFVIQYANGANRDVLSRTTTLFFRPQSPPGSMDGGGMGLR